MKKLFFINKLMVGLVSTVALSSCDLPLEQVGPNICPSNSFVFEASDLKLDVLDGALVKDIASAGNTVDFSKGGLHIHADLGEIVSWELKISNDDEQKVYSGKSDNVDIYWYGQGDKFDMQNMQFDPGATTIEFEIVCLDMISKKFTVKGVQNFENIDPEFGVMLRDWDQNGVFPVAGTSFSGADGWAGSGGGADPFVFDYFTASPSPAGGAYAEFHGVTPAAEWYLGATSFPITGIESSLTSTNTDEIYLNIFVKGDVHPFAASQVSFKIGTQVYSFNENITWSGWKLISHKLSDYTSKTGDPLNSTALSEAILQLAPGPEAVKELTVNYDFMFFTIGAPLFKD
jgi:hypothetical protein